jgi:hypothetical protein
VIPDDIDSPLSTTLLKARRKSNGTKVFHEVTESPGVSLGRSPV